MWKFFVLFGLAPLAVLTTGGEVELNGKVLRDEGVPNWPVDAGDEIQTGTKSALITFPDGLKATLAPHTRLVVQKCDRCVAQLYQGGLDYDKPAGSKAEICALGHPVRPAAGSRGSVVVESAEKVLVRVAGLEKVATVGKCGCGMSAATKSVIAVSAVSAGGAAATAGVVSATRPASSSTVP